MHGFRPQVDERYLQRHRLLDELPDRHGYVVWLEAPYGYGKSVLASQWGEHLESEGWRALWLAAGDADLCSQLADVLGLPASVSWDTVLDALWQTDTLLVLEDLEAWSLHEDLTPLLRDVRGLLLLASRGPLTVSELPRLYTQGRLIHLQSDDLAFTERETTGLIPDVDLARRLWERTSGWPLPLHFASLAGEMPENAALLEGMRASLSVAEWDEALLLATLSYLPPGAANQVTKALAATGFVQLGDVGYRLHALVAEAILSAHAGAAAQVLRREGGRLPPLLFGEACERCEDLDSLEKLFENPRAQVYRQAPESFLRWDALLGARRPSALRQLTVGGALRTLSRFAESVEHFEAALASGELTPNDEILALKDLCWSLAITDAGRAVDAVKRGEALLDDVDPELAGRFLSDASFVDNVAGRFDEAELKLERALEYLPADNQYRTGARINLALGRWDRRGDLDGRIAAQEGTLDAVWRLYPSDAPGQCRDLAMMHWWMGDRARARHYLERAREGARSNPLVDVEAGASLAALEGDHAAFQPLLERATKLGDAYTLDAVTMHAIDTMPETNLAMATAYLAAVPHPGLSIAAHSRLLAAAGHADKALAQLDAALTAFGPRAYQLYLTAARYRITRSRDDLEAFLALTTAGPRVLPGLIPVAELPLDRPELSLSYPLQDVLDSGWKEAVKLRLPEVPDLELTLLGSFELRLLGRKIELTARQQQLVTLLALGRSREEAAECIWPEAEVAKQRNNMGVQFSHLRKVLEPWGVATFVFEDGLRRLRSDHAELLGAIEAGEAQRVIRAYREPFAPGLALGVIEEHRNWLREEVVDCLRQAAEAEATAEPDAALAYLTRVTELDPLNEEAVKSLIDGLVRKGRSAAARRHYRAFAERLRDEMGLEPLAETRAALSSA